MNTPTTIMERALGTNLSKMSLDVASYLWGVRLDPEDEKRSNDLAAKSLQGALSEAEQFEIDE